jgi:hypothetical protein
VTLYHNRTTVSGTLYGQETFAVQIHHGIGAADISTYADLTTAAAAVGTFLTSRGGTSSTKAEMQALGNGGLITHVQVAAMVDGLVVNTGDADITVIAQSGSATLPPQNAMVTTLLTDINSRATRGRMYWPLLVPLLSAGKYGSSLTTWCNDMKAWYTGISQALATTAGGSLAVFLPSVFSRVHMTLTPVSRLRVNSIVDTQRRRSWSLIPANTTITFP